MQEVLDSRREQHRDHRREELIYAAAHEIPLGAVPRPNGLLVALPTLFLWMPLALSLANGILNVVPPLRRVAEKHAGEVGQPGYRESQRTLSPGSLRPLNRGATCTK